MEKISKKILDDAQKERDEIIKSTEQEVTQIKKQTSEELNKLEKETEEFVKEALLRERRRLVGMVKLSTRNELLQAKREIMDRIFNEALDTLVSKERGEYLDRIKNLLKETGVKDGEIVLGKEESKIDQKFIEDMNKELGANFSVSDEKAQIKGGFILRRGRIEIDSSFSAILQSKRERIELELAKLLFQI